MSCITRTLALLARLFALSFPIYPYRSGTAHIKRAELYLKLLLIAFLHFRIASVSVLLTFDYQIPICRVYQIITSPENIFLNWNSLRLKGHSLVSASFL